MKQTKKTIDLGNGITVPNNRFQRVLGYIGACREGRAAVGGMSFRRFATIDPQLYEQRFSRNWYVDWWWLRQWLGVHDMDRVPFHVHAALLREERRMLKESR